ncbi:hypothetical protein V8C40DRAFT_63523 [Trichoderma camerunense]
MRWRSGSCRKASMLERKAKAWALLGVPTSSLHSDPVHMQNRSPPKAQLWGELVHWTQGEPCKACHVGRPIALKIEDDALARQLRSLWDLPVGGCLEYAFYGGEGIRNRLEGCRQGHTQPNDITEPNRIQEDAARCPGCLLSADRLLHGHGARLPSCSSWWRFSKS